LEALNHLEAEPEIARDAVAAVAAKCS
jgi:hypothetical protein